MSDSLNAYDLKEFEELKEPETLLVHMLSPDGVLMETLEKDLPFKASAAQTIEPIPENLVKGELESYVFDAETSHWSVISNYRGFLQYSTATKEESFVDYLGEIKEGYTLDTPISEACNWVDGKWMD